MDLGGIKTTILSYIQFMERGTKYHWGSNDNLNKDDLSSRVPTMPIFKGELLIWGIALFCPVI